MIHDKTLMIHYEKYVQQVHISYRYVNLLYYKHVSATY
jgi:hypothetical protein